MSTVTHDFDKDGWELHWKEAVRHEPGHEIAANPYLERELAGLRPGTALDAGCGEGAEALWLAAAGWEVTAADISAEALARSMDRATRMGAGVAQVRWVEADLTTWEPPAPFDLVMTHYAHPATSQLAFYERIAGWVAPGGTLLIVGHLHGHGHHPEAATASVAGITDLLDGSEWDIVTAEARTRGELHDVVVRATRRAAG